MLTAIVRRPPTHNENPPVLVLLHGLGSNERDLMELAPELDSRLLVVSIRAPIEVGYGGYAWFDVRWDSAGIHADPSQALAGRDLLIATLKALPESLGVKTSRMLLGGFSQGAMMSLGVALIEPDLVAGVLSMSGRLLPQFLPPEAEDQVQRPSAKTCTLTDLPVLVQHGTRDDVLPVQGSREIRDFLANAGCDVSYHEYPMAHEISYESLRDIREWITARIEEALPQRDI